MLLLTSESDLIQIITGSAGTIKVHASLMDVAGAPQVVTPVRLNEAAISTAATTTVVDAPAASTQRNVKMLSVRNAHASVSNLVTIQHTDGTTAEELWKGTLLPGEGVILDAEGRFTLYDANGAVKSPTAKLNTLLHVTSDVTNATTSFADITDLTIPLLSGKKYAFDAVLFHKGDATSTGHRFGYNIGAAPTYARFSQMTPYTPSVTTSPWGVGVTPTRDVAGSAGTTGSGTTETCTLISGFIIPSADGTFALRCASEVNVAGGLVVLRGSYLSIREVDN